jgi:hypothetical protein
MQLVISSILPPKAERDQTLERLAQRRPR